MKKIILAAAAALIIAGGGIGYIAISKDEPKPAQSTSQSKPKTSDISYKGAEGKNALELLKQSYKTETREYSGLGEMVVSINGKTADSKHFWAFYVNGQQAQEGASSYTTKPADKIVWKLEAIK